VGLPRAFVEASLHQLIAAARRRAAGFPDDTSASIQDAKRNLEARKRRYLERKRCRSVVTRSANG
jgi:hypothetical protein